MGNIKRLENKRIAILGLGIENQAMLDYLLKRKLPLELTVCDRRSWQELGERFRLLSEAAEKNKKIKLDWQLGEEFNQKLYQFDILFRSPGWTLACPGIKEALKKNKKIELSSPMNMFFELCPSKNIIGVTGSKGKGTTSSLIYEILKTDKKRAWLGGNIGVAPFQFIEKVKPQDWVVLELSSFQLQDLRHSPRVAVITNFTREHLAPADPNNPNYHQTMAEYWKAKYNIFAWQKKGDSAIANEKLKTRFSKLRPNGKMIYFGKSALPTSLIGEHNQENIAAAIEAAKLAGVKKENIARAVAKFKGLEHRLELVREVGGIKYYNDSFATTPEATMTAIKSFSAPVVLLAGGAEKNSDFKQMAKVAKRKVKFVVLLMGDATERLEKELLKQGYQKERMSYASNIRQAVELANSQALPGEIVLLSTACASFGMFKNYKERGLLFKQEVERLGKK